MRDHAKSAWSLWAWQWLLYRNPARPGRASRPLPRDGCRICAQTSSRRDDRRRRQSRVAAASGQRQAPATNATLPRTVSEKGACADALDAAAAMGDTASNKQRTLWRLVYSTRRKSRYSKTTTRLPVRSGPPALLGQDPEPGKILQIRAGP